MIKTWYAVWNPPATQSMGSSAPALLSRREQVLTEKTEELERLCKNLDLKEDRLEGSVPDPNPHVQAARWNSLLAERQLLAQRWAVLREDKALLAMSTRTTSRQLEDFEPGVAPFRDVTCGVVTHQFDFPCFSCCFQR